MDAHVRGLARAEGDAVEAGQRLGGGLHTRGNVGWSSRRLSPVQSGEPAADQARCSTAAGLEDPR